MPPTTRRALASGRQRPLPQTSPRPSPPGPRCINHFALSFRRVLPRPVCLQRWLPMLSVVAAGQSRSAHSAAQCSRVLLRSMFMTRCRTCSARRRLSFCRPRLLAARSFTGRASATFPHMLRARSATVWRLSSNRAWWSRLGRHRSARRSSADRSPDRQWLPIATDCDMWAM